jgi:hypothetical protein
MSILGARPPKGINSYQFEHSEDGINMPPLVGSKSFRSQRDLRGHTKLKLVIGDFQECKQLPDKDSDILFVDERI